MDLPSIHTILLYTEATLTKLVAQVVRSSRIWDTKGRERLGANKKCIYSFMEGLQSALFKANCPYFCGGDTNLSCFFLGRRSRNQNTPSLTALFH